MNKYIYMLITVVKIEIKATKEAIMPLYDLTKSQ